MSRTEPTAASGHRRVALAVLSVANSLVVLDGLIVAVALPAIQDALGFGPADLQWVVNAYVLCFGGGLLVGGRLGDLVGRRRVAVAGLLVFAAGSLLAGLAPSAGWLVAGRALQGTGAAVMDPALLALLITTFPERAERNRALGAWSAAGSLGIPAGALLGGLLTSALGWRWVLLATAPVALLAAFVVVERRSPAPLVPSSIFRVPGLVAADLAAATLPVGLGALLFVGTLHLQQVLGYTALRTGLAYLALSLPVVAASPAAACLVTRLGRRSVAVAGLLLQAAGLLLLLRITPGGGFLTEILPGFVLVGADAPTPSALAAGFRAGFLVAAALCLLGALAALRLRAGVEGGPGTPLQRSTRGPGPRPSGRAPVDGPNRPPACR